MFLSSFSLDPRLILCLQASWIAMKAEQFQKYTPRDVQNELIELCGDYICNLLLQDCNSVPSFDLLAG